MLPMQIAFVNATKNELANCPNTYRFFSRGFSGLINSAEESRALARAALPEQTRFPAFQQFLILLSDFNISNGLTELASAQIQSKYPVLAKFLVDYFVA